MTDFSLLIGAVIGGAIGWWLATRRASLWLKRERAGMRRQVLQWQESAERARAEVGRLAREKESWAAGCKQGREDVISIMPLLIAAQQWPGDPPRAAAEGNDHS